MIKRDKEWERSPIPGRRKSWLTAGPGLDWLGPGPASARAAPRPPRCQRCQPGIEGNENLLCPLSLVVIFDGPTDGQRNQPTNKRTDGHRKLHLEFLCHIWKCSLQYFISHYHGQNYIYVCYNLDNPKELVFEGVAVLDGEGEGAWPARYVGKHLLHNWYCIRNIDARPNKNNTGRIDRKIYLNCIIIIILSFFFKFYWQLKA